MLNHDDTSSIDTKQQIILFTWTQQNHNKYFNDHKDDIIQKWEHQPQMIITSKRSNIFASNTNGILLQDTTRLALFNGKLLPTPTLIQMI